MDNNQTAEVVVEQQPVVAPDLNTKVSDAEAQRKTGIMLEGMFAFFEFLVGASLLIVGAVLLAKMGGWKESTAFKGTTERYAMNSYFAMLIVGAFLTIEAILATILTMEMQLKNKTEKKIPNSLGWLTLITLNPGTVNMIRRSNGWLSRKDKKKLAKKQQIAQSDDTVENN